jgi:HD-like signal output (HDOD) protein
MSATVLDPPPFSTATSSRPSIFECLENPQATAVLPSLESILAELNKLTTRGSSHMEEITRLVRLDQSLSLQVLRIANSAYYAPTSPIADVPAALLYVGLSTLKGALVSTRCMERTCHIQQDIFDWKQFWIHAAGVGHLTMELARHLLEPALALEAFFLMGQFHDVGKVVLACLMPEDFAEIYTRAAAERVPVSTLEIEALGVEHGHLGAWYMERQGIPLMLREPVRFHHCLVREEKPHYLHAALIRLADQLAHEAGIGQSGNCAARGNPYASPEWEWYLTHCDVTGAAGERLKATMITQVERISGLVREIIT